MRLSTFVIIIPYGQIAHPNICKIQYGSSDDAFVYFVLPYHRNGSIEKLINSRYLNVREIIRLGLDFLMAVHFVHTNRLIHFDIKPTNILIDDSGKAILTDFGLARFTDIYGTAEQTKLYTSHIAPEFSTYDRYTASMDIYQVGVTLYRMCNGNATYKAQFESFLSADDFINAIQQGKFPNRQGYLPHIPKKMRKVVNKAMEPDPNKRYGTILQLINDLSSICECLDWQYSCNKDEETWSINNSENTHCDILRLYSTSDNEYCIDSKKVRLSDGKETVNRQYCFKSLTYINAYKQIEDVIRNW